MVTKRQLGWFVLAMSVVSIAGIIAVDALGAGRWGGFGPLQRGGIALGLIAIIAGLVLVLRGDQPA